MKRVICIGNRFVDEDAAGPRVHDRLQTLELPDDVEVVDGGLCGLDLLRLVDGAERVVFVDSVSELGPAGAVLQLDCADVAATAPSSFGHDAGLGYLLRVLPLACDEPLPAIEVVGVAHPADETSIDRAARLCASLVGGAHGSHATGGAGEGAP